MNRMRYETYQYHWLLPIKKTEAVSEQMPVLFLFSSRRGRVNIGTEPIYNFTTLAYFRLRLSDS